MSLACHRLPPPPWFTRPVTAARGAAAAGLSRCETVTSGSAALYAAIPADRAGVSCSSRAGLSHLTQRSALCALGDALPAHNKAAAGYCLHGVIADGSRTTTSRAHRPAALPSDATNFNAKVQDSTAPLTPETSVVGGGGVSDGGSTGGGDGKAGGVGGGDGGGRGGSNGSGDELPERPSISSLLLVPLAAAAVLAARWGLTRQRRVGAHVGAAHLESVNRSGNRRQSCVELVLLQSLFCRTRGSGKQPGCWPDAA